jgi:hypothetical protein
VWHSNNGESLEIGDLNPAPGVRSAPVTDLLNVIRDYRRLAQGYPE